MAIAGHELPAETLSLRADKAEIRRIVAEQHLKMCMVYDPTTTAERAQQLVAECLREHGITPEDNIFSRGIIAARDGE